MHRIYARDGSFQVLEISPTVPMMFNFLLPLEHCKAFGKSRSSHSVALLAVVPRIRRATIRRMTQTLILHADAPPKPEEGKPCNGCGWCCVAERCPVSWLFLPLGKRACTALEWDGEMRRYLCGLVTHPAKHVGWLPRRWQDQFSRWFAYRIAASRGCDFAAREDSAA